MTKEINFLQVSQHSLINNQLESKGTKTLDIVLNVIQNGKFSESVKRVREAYWEEDYPALFKGNPDLQAFVPSGSLERTEDGQSIKDYSGIVLLQTEELTLDKLDQYRSCLAEHPNALAIFTSICGTKLDVLVRVGTTPSEHSNTHEKIRESLSEEYGITFGTWGEGISDFCLLSHDPNLVSNPNCIPFGATQEPSIQISSNPISEDEFDGLIEEECIDCDIDLRGLVSADKIDRENFPPFFPESIYHSIPWQLKKACEIIEDRRSKDMVLLGSLVALSSCFPGVHGLYDNRTYRSNFFGFVSAPPASGKGLLVFSKMLVSKISIEKILEKNSSSPLVPDTNQPKGLTNKILVIPGNASEAALLGALKYNEGIGLVFETEATTVKKTLTKEWGDFSDLINKAFQHEPVGSLRKPKEKTIEHLLIEKPLISMLLSGTPDQISIIPSTQDGLFSRFLFYVFSSTPIWKDVSPNPGRPSFDEYFNQIATEIERWYSSIHIDDIYFELTKDQWERLNLFYSQNLRRVFDSLGGDTSSIVKRLGLIQFRLAMILSILRREESDLSIKLVCQQEDFEIAEKITKTCLVHDTVVYSKLQRFKNQNFKPKVQLFFEKLPSEFERKTAVEAGEVINLSSSQVDRILKSLIKDGFLQKSDHGKYKKLSDSES